MTDQASQVSGNVSVPREPTGQMLDAGDVAHAAGFLHNRIALIYRAMIAAAPAAPIEQPREIPVDDQIGYAFHNPDTGMEWSENHPRESGEVPDAGRCSRMTLATFREKYGFGDHDTTGEIPVAGGEVEVLACLTAVGNFYFPSKNIDFLRGDTALVDRAHITRLQDEVIRHERNSKDLEAASLHWMAERDASRLRWSG